MSFYMDVRVDKVYEEGSYRATLENVEPKDTKFGERLMWTFRLLDENGEVVGFTSMSPRPPKPTPIGGLRPSWAL
jgi:hypothetical protein